MKAMTAMASSAEQVLRPGFFGGIAKRSDASTPAAKPPEPESDKLESSVYRFVWKHSKRQQILLVLLTLASFPFLYYSLKLPKTIINRGISGKHFPQQLFGLDF